MASCTNSFLPWAAPLLTLIGWFLVNHQNNKRELRKEARSAADRCKLLTRDVSLVAHGYWTGKTDATAWQIKALLEELEVDVCRFPENNGRRGLLDKHIDLVDAITTADFESSNFQPLDAGDEVLRRIAQARQRLLVEIEHVFETHYQ